MKLLLLVAVLDAVPGGAVDGENVNGAVPLLVPPNPKGFTSPVPPNENVTRGVPVVVVEVVAGGAGEPNAKVADGAVEAAAAGGEAPKVKVDDPPKPNGFTLSVAGEVVVLVPNENTGADGVALTGAEDAPNDIAPNTPVVVETAGDTVVAGEAAGGADGEPKENAGIVVVSVVAALLSLAGEAVDPKLKAGVIAVLPNPKGFAVSVVGGAPNVNVLDPKSPPLFGVALGGVGCGLEPLDGAEPLSISRIVAKVVLNPESNATTASL